MSITTLETMADQSVVAEAGGARPSTATLAAEITDLGPWFHNLHLPNGLQTAPNHPLGDFPAFKWQQLAPHLPADLRGWRVLDIGCNAGYYTFELARRGGHVLGIDVDSHFLRQAAWAAKQLGLQDQVEFEQIQLYELAHRPVQFDLVLFMGVFYHLRYPLLGLDIVAQRVTRLLVFQTLTMPDEARYQETHGLQLNEREAFLAPGWPKLAFIEHEFADDPTNWWAPNPAGVEAMLRSSGLRILAQPGHEIYLCAPDLDHPSCITTWNVAEYLAATGQSTGAMHTFSNRESPAAHQP
jgi:tRNA (mo5U34)-methyltransferase